MLLRHISTGVYFEYIRTYLPQFTRQKFVELKNCKTLKVERFPENTYMNYFEIVEDWLNDFTRFFHNLIKSLNRAQQNETKNNKKTD